MKTVATFIGSSRLAVFGRGRQPAVTLTATNMSLIGNSRANVPMCSPYGFISVPVDYVQCVVISTGVGRANPLIVSTIPVVPTEWTFIPDLDKGESCWYVSSGVGSMGYSMKNGKSGFQYQFTNPLGAYLATPISGENVNIILEDIIEAFSAMSTFLNQFISNYNAHEHSVPGIQTGMSTVGTTGNTAPQPIYTPPANLQEDLVAIEAGQTLINDGGISPFRSP